MAKRWIILLCLLISTGCKFSIKSIPVTEHQGSSVADGGSEGGNDAASRYVTDGGDQLEPEPDAGADGTDAGHAHYPGCAAALPEILPTAPVVKTDENHRPLFDTFRDLDCEKLAPVSTCEASAQDAGCGAACFSEEAKATPLCVAVEPLANCMDDGMTILSAQHGSCRACATVETKARLCCSDAQRFDCRAWPYEHDGLVGDVCARHEDCTPGLLCKDSGHGFGMCTCPESAARNDDDNSCAP